MSILKRILCVLFLLLGVFLLAVRWGNSRSQPAHSPGLTDDGLADCPDTPNCVSSQRSDPEHFITPIPFTQSAEEAQRRLEDIIGALPRNRIVTRRPGYLHAEFRSFLLGFVDDAEFVIDDSEQLILMRSASRVGRSDLGVNRRRMEEIRTKFESR
ncbi:MAG: DUF1499 domain-containing protein [Planctomycetales bacterium]|nr:DUF1499 domain-containing protein [Planctomycetales bacterium]